MEGFQVADIIVDDGYNLQAFVGYAPSLRSAVVAFRGTQSTSLDNWIQDLKFFHTDFQYPRQDGVDPRLDVRVHRGFYEAYHDSVMKGRVTAAVDRVLEEQSGWIRGRPGLLVAGHSLGGAMAQVAAADLGLALVGRDVEVTVHTFGSPRVGNEDFGKMLLGLLDESVRVTHNHDVVPSLPPAFAGFHHAPRELYTVTRDDLPGLVVARWCDGSGEDPTCYGGACGFDGFGPCTSVSDHLSYMGIALADQGDCRARKEGTS